MYPKKYIQLITLLSINTATQAEALQGIDIKNSVLEFSYQQMGVASAGHAQFLDAQLSFDPKNIAAAKITLTLNTASIATESPEANDVLHDKDWFYSKAYPQATFVSETFKTLGNNRYSATGKLDIKGHSQIISTAFTVKPQLHTSMLEGAFILNRADFEIGSGAWADSGVVANEVHIQYKLPVLTGK